mgnify:FL=1
MAIQRFFGNFDFSEKEIGKKIEISDKNIIHQIKNVLRLKIGDEIVLCDGKSNEAVSKIIDSPIVRFAEDSAKRSGNKDSLSLDIVKVFKNNNESEKDIILYCSILKKENFELVVQKAVEIGVKEIIPIITKRTVKLNLKYDRLEKIIKEAAEQSGRGILPILRKAMDFKKAIEEAEQNNINLFFDISGKKISENQLKLNQEKIGLFIGPEGGWDAEELEFAKYNNKFEILSFGKLTFRAETAAIIVSYIFGL